MAMAVLVERIAPRGEGHTLVVYGAADFCHATKGRVSTHYKKLRRRVEARDNVTFVAVGECNTSQKCSACSRKMASVMGWEVRNERVRRERIHAVKVCPNCSTTWNRDTNAARNIRTILRGRGERPAAFMPARRQRRGRASGHTVVTTSSAGVARSEWS